MFEGHFGLRENPFVAAHQTRYIYPSPEHQEALAHLRYGIENREPFVLITGEVGTGKTTALFDALSEWEDRAIVGLITNSSLTRAELLEEIALRLGMALPPGASKPQIMVALEQHLLAIHGEGHRAILLLDEAQNLERELLEEIRLLSNLESNGDKLVQIFLVGQPELEGRLGRPELRQLRQRVAVHYRLRPLGATDAERYIHHRITVAGGHALTIFPSEACLEVHRLTNGIPREMNHLCSQAMISAFVEGAPAVSCDHVRAAAHELEFQSVLGKERRTRSIRPAIERRQGPTVPGAAPPPEREVQRPAPPPPAQMPSAAPPAAPVWEPDELEASEGDDGAEPDSDPDVTDDWEDEESGPETGPPRLEPARPLAPVPPVPSEPAGTPTVTAHGRAVDPPAAAASSDDWQSWFQSLTSQAESAVEADSGALAPEDDEDQDDDEAMDTPESAPPRFEELEREVIAAPRAEARASEQPAQPAAVEPAASTTRFAEALRRAQAGQPDAADEEDVRERATAALDAMPAEPAPEPARTPRRFADDDAAFDALPPRLREKMSEAEDTSRERNPLPVRLMIAVALLLVVVVGAALAQRFLFTGADPDRDATATDAAVPAEPAQAGANASEEATADRATETPRGGTPRPAAEQAGNAGNAPAAAAPEPAPADAPKSSVTQPPAAPATSARSVPATPAAPATTYLLAVGTYLNEDRAREEQSKLSAGTRFTASVSTVQEDNVAMYRVVMGDFPTRNAAERVASDLISRGLVDEARVLTRTAGSR